MSRNSQAAKALAGQMACNSTQSSAIGLVTRKVYQSWASGNSAPNGRGSSPDDGSPWVAELLQLELALNLNRVAGEEFVRLASEDLEAVGQQLGVLKALSPEAAKAIEDGGSEDAYLKDSRVRMQAATGQMADAVASNAVFMGSGNRFALSAENVYQAGRSLFARYGTSTRIEAPIMTDNAHTRILLAHLLLEEADLLVRRASAMLSQVRETYGLEASDIMLIAKQNLALHGKRTTVVADQLALDAGQIRVGSQRATDLIVAAQRIDLNPDDEDRLPERLVRSVPAALPTLRTRAKQAVDLPQWSDKFPMPCYITPDDEVRIQKQGEG